MNRRGWAALAAVMAAVLVGCAAQDAATASESEAAVEPEPEVDVATEYAETVRDGFGEAYLIDRDEETDYDVDAAAWDGFARTVADLTPPEATRSAHHRMVAMWDAYVDARREASQVCDAVPSPALQALRSAQDSPAPGGEPHEGDCFRVISSAEDGYRSAVEAIYDATGMDHADLFAKIDGA